jgi:PAS domain S-box-containing protein
MNYESGSLLENVVRSSVDGILAFDRECRYVLWNAAMERLSGVPESRTLGRIAFDVFPFLLEIGEDEYFHRALRGESSVAHDRPFSIPETNREGIFEGYYSPLLDANGEVVGGVAVIRDVTERKRSEADRAELVREQAARREAEHIGRLLRESEDRYRTFMAQSAEGIWRIALDEPVRVDLPVEEQVTRFFRFGFLAECNDAMAKMYGYGRADELEGARLGELLIPTDPANEAYLQAFVESGYRLENAESHEVDRNGREKYFLNTLTGTIEDGALLHAWGMQRDVTHLHRVEAERERLLASERRSRMAAEEAVARHTAIEERLTALVEASAVMLGTLRLDAVQPAILDLSHRLVAADAYAIWRRLRVADALHWKIVSAAGVSDDYLNRIVVDAEEDSRAIDRPVVSEDVLSDSALAHRRDAYLAEGIVAMLAVPLRIHGEHGGSLVFYFRRAHAFDESEVLVASALANLAGVAITNAELYEEQSRVRATAEEANRLKDEFLATMSHELRTPLNAIIGWTRLLVSRKLDEASAERALETIDRNARAQAQIVGDLLDVSRIITGKLRLETRHVDMSATIEAALEALRPAANAKGIQLITTLDPLAGPVMGDPDRLQQVIWNLVSNAVKFTPRGGRVVVAAKRIESHVEVSIVDTGIGIEPDFLPFVFDRFRQADSSTARAHGGLGLGLAIVRQLVDLHGGRVSVSSEGRDRGSTFTLVLPLAVVSPREGRTPGTGSSPSAQPELSAPPSLAGLTVFVVDDLADTREVVRETLTGVGATVVEFSDGRTALDQIAAGRPDVIVSDLGMPGFDGYTFIAAVRALPPDAGGRTPAIALTAYARPEDRIRALASGFQMHVPKPLDPMELMLAIANLAGWST